MRWTAARLAHTWQRRFGAARLVVVTNREPVLEAENGTASGVVNALEPVLRACGGMWMARGSLTPTPSSLGLPYRYRRVQLPSPTDPRFNDRFANDGLWPWCHQMETSVELRDEDWQAYLRTNVAFARAILAEVGTEPAVVWIHDYHFALLPRLLRTARPDLTVAQFWHIPWPRLEMFRHCPWQRDLLDGLCANDLVGFQTPRDLDNFLALRAGEGTGGTAVGAFPISVDFSAFSRQAESAAVQCEIERWRNLYRLRGKRLCLGIDRLDDTKGIPERLRAFAHFLQRSPQYRRQVVFLQAGPACRTHLERYRAVSERIARLVQEINAQYGDAEWQPIVFLPQHLSLVQLVALYRLADVCVVSALCDGMNLVAKEYVAARTDKRGVVLLSRFAGAAQELDQAILIDPHDCAGFATAFAAALSLSEAEVCQRMQRLRQQVEEQNIYRWAGEFLQTLSALQRRREVLSGRSS